MFYLLPDGKRLFFITIATYYTKSLTFLQRCCRKVGVNLIVLGLHDERIKKWAYGWKLALVKEFLETGRVDGPARDEVSSSQVWQRLAQKQSFWPFRDNDIILFTDSNDVILNNPGRGVETIYDILIRSGSQIVFGAEYPCGPYHFWTTAYPLEDTKYRHAHLNSGAYIGYASAILHWLQTRPFSYSTDDQAYWASCYLSQFLPFFKEFSKDPASLTLDRIVREKEKHQQEQNEIKSTDDTEAVLTGENKENDKSKSNNNNNILNLPVISLDHSGSFAYSPGEDTFDMFQNWTWKQTDKRWSVRANGPPGKLLRAWEKWTASKFGAQGRTDYTKYLKTTDLPAIQPCFIHCAGPKQFLSFFISKLEASLNLANKNIPTGAELWDAISLSAIIFVCMMSFTVAVTYVAKYYTLVKKTHCPPKAIVSSA